MLPNFPSHGISLKSGAKVTVFNENTKLKVNFQFDIFINYFDIVIAG